MTDKPTIRSIQDAICAEFGITRDEMVSASRLPKFVRPRHIAMAKARETGASFPKIAKAFARKDHTTIIHACRKVGLT